MLLKSKIDFEKEIEFQKENRHILAILVVIYRLNSIEWSVAENNKIDVKFASYWKCIACIIHPTPQKKQKQKTPWKQKQKQNKNRCGPLVSPQKGRKAWINSTRTFIEKCLCVTFVYWQQTKKLYQNIKKIITKDATKYFHEIQLCEIESNEGNAEIAKHIKNKAKHFGFSLQKKNEFTITSGSDADQTFAHLWLACFGLTVDTEAYILLLLNVSALPIPYSENWYQPIMSCV